jgi:hypothetical protein
MNCADCGKPRENPEATKCYACMMVERKERCFECDQPGSPEAPLRAYFPVDAYILAGICASCDAKGDFRVFCMDHMPKIPFGVLDLAATEMEKRAS